MPGWEQREAAEKEKRRPLSSFHSAKRKAMKLQRTPAWSETSEIRELYITAQKVSRDTKEPHVVDHIFPLQGRKVSGLHILKNLRIITAVTNSKKRNQFDENIEDIFQTLVIEFQS